MTGTDTSERECIEAGILENALVMIAVLEKDGTIVSWNHAAEAITGYRSADVVGHSGVWKNLYPDPEYRRNVTGRIRKILSAKNYFEDFETVIRTSAGESRTILWNTKEIAPGGLSRVVTVGMDITTQKDLAAFRESIIDNAYILLAVLGEKGEIIIWNKAAETITGYFRTEVVGRHDVWKSLYPDPEYRAKITRQITQIIEKQRYFENLETTITTRGGDKRVISWNTRQIGPERDSHTIAIGRDITEQRQAEEALIAYITEMAMRLKQPIAIIGDNLHEVAGLVRSKKIGPDEIAVVLEGQARNADQIATNVGEFQRAIVEKNRDIPEAYRKFLEQ